jgi:hypothetical protein
MGHNFQGQQGLLCWPAGYLGHPEGVEGLAPVAAGTFSKGVGAGNQVGNGLTPYLGCRGCVTARIGMVNRRDQAVLVAENQASGGQDSCIVFGCLYPPAQIDLAAFIIAQVVQPLWIEPVQGIGAGQNGLGP